MLSDVRQPGQVLLMLASSLMQPQEPMLSYGPVHWEELGQAVHQRYAQGLLVGTDRRFLFLGEAGGNPTTIMYCEVGALDVIRRLLGCTLRVTRDDAETATVFGRKKLLSGMGDLFESRRDAEVPKVTPTVLAYKKGNLSLTCVLCLTRTALTPRCPGCARPVDTAASAEAIKAFKISVAEFNRKIAEPNF